MAKNIKLERALVHIHATFNNTIITATDMNGNPIAWKSPGTVGYKGSKKGTPYAAQIAADALARGDPDYQGFRDPGGRGEERHPDFP